MLEPTRRIAALAAGVARHASWYLRYRVQGTTRDVPPPPARDGGSSQR